MLSAVVVYCYSVFHFLRTKLSTQPKNHNFTLTANDTRSKTIKMTVWDRNRQRNDIGERHS